MSRGGAYVRFQAVAGATVVAASGGVSLRPSASSRRCFNGDQRTVGEERSVERAVAATGDANVYAQSGCSAKCVKLSDCDAPRYHGAICCAEKTSVTSGGGCSRSRRQ
jgi:hypothetical protein